ncbi:MAG: hypothetical protein ACI9VR_004353 [Cognaticolwellia sp.]|jgi:hypothetical protein
MPILLALALSGCTKGNTGDTGPSTDTNPIEVDTGVEEDVGPYDAVLTGLVTVQLYDIDADGERIEIDESELSSFPFGKIWVTASTSEDGSIGSDTIKTPTLGGDTYSLDVSVEEAGSVTLYAQLDRHADGVLGSYDPIGTYPSSVSISASETLSSLNVTIDAYYDIDGSDGGGGPGCSTASLSGDALITRSYAGGDVAVMLMSTDGMGPWNVNWVSPVASGSGASAAYSINSCLDSEYDLVGAWDSDGDDLITPADTWGAYIEATDVDGNPVSAGSDQTGMDIQIPLGGSPFGAFPFVSIEGEVTVRDAGFGEYPENSTVHVSALKYRPDGDLTMAELNELAYSVQSYTWDQINGESVLPYSLTVPAGTIIYLWAFVDADNDGVLNGPKEPVASADGSTGKLPTGSADITQNMELGAYTPDE